MGVVDRWRRSAYDLRMDSSPRKYPDLELVARYRKERAEREANLKAEEPIVVIMAVGALADAEQ